MFYELFSHTGYSHIQKKQRVKTERGKKKSEAPISIKILVPVLKALILAVSWRMPQIPLGICFKVLSATRNGCKTLNLRFWTTVLMQ